MTKSVKMQYLFIGRIAYKSSVVTGIMKMEEKKMLSKEKSLKYFVSVAVMLVVFSLFVGCDNNGASGEDGDVTLVMSTWNAGIEFTVLIEAFEDQHPNINIEVIDVASPNYTERIVTMLAGGETLDIIPIIDMPLYVNLSERGQLKDLTDFVQGLGSDARSAALDFMPLDGVYYAIPFRWHFYVLFYNKDIFDAAGIPYPEHLTWDEYRELALQLTSGEGADKVYGAHLHIWRSITHGIASAQTGYSQLTDDFSFLIDQYELVLAMQEEGSIMDFGVILAADVGYRPRFELGHAAMIPMGAWYLGELAERAEFNWGIAPMPQISRDSEITTMGMPTSFGINANTNHPEEALMFIEFATGPEGAMLIAEIGNVPALMTDEVLDVYFSVPGMANDELTRRTFNPDRVEIEMQLSNLTGEVDQILAETHELIMTGEISLEEGIEQMNERVGAVLNRQ